LAQRLTAAHGGAARAAAYRQAVGMHVAVNRERYAFFLAGLDVARQHYCGDQLELALALPIPILAYLIMIFGELMVAMETLTPGGRSTGV
jgi:hypothetical protein